MEGIKDEDRVSSLGRVPGGTPRPCPAGLQSLSVPKYYCFSLNLIASLRKLRVCLQVQVIDMVQEGGQRKRPNILVSGTPGTGKTTMASALAEAIHLRHINIGELVKEKNLHDGWDDELDCYVINEDLVSY